MKQIRKEEALTVAGVSGRSPNNREAQGDGDRERTLADTVLWKDQKVGMASEEKHQPFRRKRREDLVEEERKSQPFENDSLVVTEALVLSD